MVAEIKSFSQIMADLLATFPDTYDKRQGSTLYNLMGPVAQEMDKVYGTLEFYETANYIDTAGGEFLTRLALQFGVDRLPAVAAIREVYFGEVIQLGTRFSVVDSPFNFRVLEEQTGGNYLVVAEEPGSASNFVEGSLINIDVLDEFQGAALGPVVIPGEDEESDEALRRRVIEYVKTPTLNGNEAQYIKWASEFEGVGSVLVDALWDGENTVKLSITDSDGNEASPELVNRFQLYIDPEPKGHGLGVAPIGAYVTVGSVGGYPVTIEINVAIENDASISDIEITAAERLTEYLKGEAFQDKTVRPFKIAGIVDAIQGIKAVDEVKVNGSTGNLPLVGDVLPKLEGVDFIVDTD